MTEGFNFLFDRLTGAMLLDIFGGNSFALFIFFMIFLTAFGIALRFTGELMILTWYFGVVIFLTMLTSSLGWVLGLISLLLGIFVGIFLIYTLISR